MSQNLIWQNFVGGGSCSENSLTENECLELTSESIDLVGDGDPDACSNGGSSESEEFEDCDNSTNWVPAQGTEDIEQTGQENEPTEDDIAEGCTNSGESSSGNYLDCDNSILNTSETLWDYGQPWNDDDDVYIPAYCFSTNQDQERR